MALRKRLSRFALGILLGCVWSAADAFAAACDEPLATDHWAYETIEELYAAGVWGRWPIGTRPWYRGDIAARVQELARDPARRTPALRPEQAWLLSKLESELADLLNAEGAGAALEFRIGAAPGVRSELDYRTDPLLRSRIAAFAGVGGRFWWARMRGDIDSHGDLDPTFFGRRWKGNLTGTMDLGFFSYRRSGLEVLVGRDFMRWGTAGHDALLLNDQSPPFDLVRLGYRHRYFDFHYFVTGLDSDFASPGDDSVYTGPGVRRYFAGHRLVLYPTNRLSIGLSEVVIWGGPARQLEAYYLNPFLPYYWEQVNADKDDNPLWSLELSYLVSGGFRFYGEWLIDDFQIDFSSEPHQIGGMLGVNWTDPLGLAGGYLTADWTRIQPAVYGQNRPYNRYLNRRIGIGSVLGPDADRWYFRWRQHLSQPFDLTGTVVTMRQGEREIDMPQENAVPYGEGFPTGTPARSTRLEASLLYYPGAHLRVELTGGYEWQGNVDHVAGAARDGGFAHLAIDLADWFFGRF